MQFLLKGAGGCMRICPASVHVFCGPEDNTFQVKGGLLSQLKEFKYLRVLFTQTAMLWTFNQFGKDSSKFF